MIKSLAIGIAATCMVRTTIWAKHVAVSDLASVVTVCMDQLADSPTLRRARAEADKIFEQVPVRIEWSSGRSCKQSGVIHIRLKEQTPVMSQPGALAYALPYQGSTIEVFYDRIQSMVPSLVLPHLLAHVLVHEIAHILEGVARHSETGIMKAHWTPADLSQMRVCPLSFAKQDIKLIEDGVKNRRDQLELRARISGVDQSHQN